jgi:hypothetical protein
MATVIEATFDGKVFHPREPVKLQPNTPVRLIVEAVPPESPPATSFLQTARSLSLEGPPDWSENLGKYLYGDDTELHGGR